MLKELGLSNINAGFTFLTHLNNAIDSHFQQSPSQEQVPSHIAEYYEIQQALVCDLLSMGAAPIDIIRADIIATDSKLRQGYIEQLTAQQETFDGLPQHVTFTLSNDFGITNPCHTYGVGEGVGVSVGSSSLSSS